jgi:hypothetical protein
VFRVSSPLSTRRSSRYSTSPLNPTRTLERELANADREESDSEDQSDPVSEVESLATRGGGSRVISTVPVQPMAELTVKEAEQAEKLRTILLQSQEVHDAKPWGFLTGDAKTGLLTRWKANQGVLPEPLKSDPATHNGEQFVQLITLLFERLESQ